MARPDRHHATPRPALLALGAMALLVGCRAAPSSDALGPVYVGPPPNIVVIVVDDLRWDDIGVAGHPFVQTPAIDQLAREGAMFDNAFATTPLCSPGRASLLTGLYPHTHGITDNTDHSIESHQLPTFARDLQLAGYTTGFVGKWHMGNDETRRPGFDYWAALRGQGEAIDPFLNDGVSTTQFRCAPVWKTGARATDRRPTAVGTGHDHA